MKVNSSKKCKIICAFIAGQEVFTETICKWTICSPLTHPPGKKSAVLELPQEVSNEEAA